MSYNEKDHKIYESIFKDPPVDWKNVPLTPIFDECVKFFKDEGVTSVIDFGCGPGVWANHLGNNGLLVRGFDFSKSAVDYANNWAKETGYDLQFECAAVTENPFSEDFDAGLATQILENVGRNECVAAIKSMCAAVKPAGVVFAMFNPFMSDEMIEQVKNSDNPTKECTSVNYTDAELGSLFSERFELVDFSLFEGKTRAIKLRKR